MKNRANEVRSHAFSYESDLVSHLKIRTKNYSQNHELPDDYFMDLVTKLPASLVFPGKTSKYIPFEQDERSMIGWRDQVPGIGRVVRLS